MSYAALSLIELVHIIERVFFDCVAYVRDRSFNFTAELHWMLTVLGEGVEQQLNDKININKKNIPQVVIYRNDKTKKASKKERFFKSE